MANDIYCPQPDTIEVLRACEKCCAQWEAFRRAHGLPRGSKAGNKPMPQSSTELIMEATGCDAMAALQELMRAQRLGLVLLPGDGLGEPYITQEGRRFLAEARKGRMRMKREGADKQEFEGWHLPATPMLNWAQSCSASGRLVP